MKKTAIVLSDNQLDTSHGKSAHGMILGNSRFEILAVVDPSYSGEDAGHIIDGEHRNINVFIDVQSAINALVRRPDCCVVGAATHAGKMSESLVKELHSAIENDIAIVNGLRDLVAEHPLLKSVLKNHPVEVIDIRKPRSWCQYHTFDGSIKKVTISRIARLGALRNNFGDNIILRVDMNQGYGLKDFEHFMNHTEDFDLELVEQPFAVAQCDALMESISPPWRKLIALDGSLDLGPDVVSGGFQLSNGIMPTLNAPGLGVTQLPTTQ